MTKTEFMEGIKILQNNYQRTFTIEQLKLFYESLKDMSKDKFIENIKKHIRTSQHMPNIAEIRKENQDKTINRRINYTNLNSSYWYANLRYFCDRDKTPYYDITNSNILLQPYK